MQSDWVAYEEDVIHRLINAISGKQFNQIDIILDEFNDFSVGQPVSELFKICLKLLNQNIQYQKKLTLFQKDIQNLFTYQYLEEKYANASPDEPSKVGHIDGKHTIWWCWLQGVENAPEIVKVCLNSVRKYSDWDLVIITKESYEKYIEIPEYIVEKHNEGIIPDPHFSDVLRVALLTKWGGIWIDATVYLTGGNLLKEIETEELFCYKHLMRGMDSNFIVASNWLIKCNPGNPIMEDLKNMLFSYWKRESKLCTYFLFHFLFTIASRKHMDMWNNVPSISNVPPHIFQTELMVPYSAKRWHELCSMSDVHKLTYKFQRPRTEQYLMWDNILESGENM